MSVLSHRLRASAAALAVAAALSATASSLASAAEKVTYLLPAPAFLPAFGPWMVALQRGYYAKDGLDVDFEAAKGGADSAKQVGAGNAVIGGALGDTPIIVRGNGVPVKLVAVLGDGGMMQLVVHANSPIKGPADLKGKTVAIMSYQDTTYYALLGMLAKVGLTKNDIDAEPAGATNIWKLFLAGKADAMASVPDWIADVENNGAKVRIIPADAYFPNMAQAIVASDQTIKEKPELIRKLLQAPRHGLKDVIDDPQGAARDYVKAVPQNAGKEAQMTQVLERYKKYVYKTQKTLGEIDVKRLAEVENFYVKSGIVEKATPINELYTEEFIK